MITRCLRLGLSPVYGNLGKQNKQREEAFLRRSTLHQFLPATNVLLVEHDVCQLRIVQFYYLAPIRQNKFLDVFEPRGVSVDLLL